MFLCLRCCDIVSCLDKKRQLVNLIRAFKQDGYLDSLGHVMRSDSLQDMLERRIKGKRQIGDSKTLQIGKR